MFTELSQKHTCGYPMPPFSILCFHGSQPRSIPMEASSNKPKFYNLFSTKCMGNTLDTFGIRGGLFSDTNTDIHRQINPSYGQVNMLQLLLMTKQWGIQEQQNCSDQMNVELNKRPRGQSPRTIIRGIKTNACAAGKVEFLFSDMKLGGFQQSSYDKLVCRKWSAGVPQEFEGGSFVNKTMGDASSSPASWRALSKNYWCALSILVPCQHALR